MVKYQDEFQDALAAIVEKAIADGCSKEQIGTILIMTAQDFCE